MGLTHHKTVCSCGAVISQCRCFSCNKTLLVKTNGCAECSGRNAAHVNRPRIVERLPEGLKLSTATRVESTGRTELQFDAPDGTVWMVPVSDSDLRLLTEHAGTPAPA